ncbi:MAG: phosphoglucosamine mutase [Gemmataceae bacterium]
MANLIVSVSGVRGIIGDGLTPMVATAFASALGQSVGSAGGPVLLARDSRPSGPMLRHAVIAGLEAAGCDVVDLGILPTPTVGVAVREMKASGAVQITASHNPAPWNGLKLFGPDGAVLSAERGAEVKRLYDTGPSLAPWDKLGGFREEAGAGDWHLERVLRHVDVGGIKARGFRVLLDANGGAGGSLGARLLQSLHTNNQVIGGDQDGRFAHPPEPLEENVGDVLEAVKGSQVDLGFILDPDADRLALVDGAGRYLGEELTLALAVLARLRVDQGPVVINMSTSRVIEDLAARFGVPCHRSAVGEANVVAKMREVNALIGGEGNGGVIDPRIGWVRDPFIGMALTLDLLVARKTSLEHIVSELPRYVIVKDKAAIAPARLPDAYRRLTSGWPEAKANTLDGLRLDWPDRWVHLRPSNTEPIVRIIAEAPAADEARRLIEQTRTLATI